MAYDNSGPTKASKLKRLTECGTVATECKQYSAFSWWYGSDGFKQGETQSSPSGQSLVPSSDQSQIIAADFTGDGRTDLAWPEGQNPPGNEPRVWKHLNATDTGTYTTVHNGEFNGYNRAATAYPIDYDLNGMVDLMPREAQINNYRPILSRPNNVHRLAETTFQGGFNQVFDTIQHAGAMLGDFDGDGYQDVLEYRDPLATPEQDYTWSWRRRTGELNPKIDNTGPFSDPQTRPFDDKAFGPQQPLPPFHKFPPHKMFVADINGDGRDELLYPLGPSMAAWDLMNEAVRGSFVGGLPRPSWTPRSRCSTSMGMA